MRLQRHVARVLVALGALSFPSRDGSTGSPLKAPQVLEMSFMCCPRASSSMLSNSLCFWSSLSLSSRSVQPRSQNRRMAPRTSRSVPEDKCEDDPEIMLPLSGIVIAHHPALSTMQWSSVAVCWSHLWLRRRVSRRQFWRRTLLWFSAELKRTDAVANSSSFFCWTFRGVSLWHMTNVANGSTSQYFALT